MSCRKTAFGVFVFEAFVFEAFESFNRVGKGFLEVLGDLQGFGSASFLHRVFSFVFLSNQFSVCRLVESVDYLESVDFLEFFEFFWFGGVSLSVVFR